nr:MAG: porin [Hyphomicrobiales bacterium]
MELASRGPRPEFASISPSSSGTYAFILRPMFSRNAASHEEWTMISDRVRLWPLIPRYPNAFTGHFRVMRLGRLIPGRDLMANWFALMRVACAASLGLLNAIAPSRAQGLEDKLTFAAPSWNIGNYELRVEGFASGSLFAASQDSGPHYTGGFSDTNGTGLTVGSLRLQRFYDSGLISGMRVNLLLANDRLSGDNYGSDFLQKIYFYVQSGIGRVEVGQQDGAGYTIGFSGPRVDNHISLENPDSSFFRNPISGDALNEFTSEVTSIQISSNASKISYISPRLFGIQIGASYTPNLVKGAVPYLFVNPSNAANTQSSIWEFAASYSRRMGEITMGVSAAYARGALRNPNFASGDIYDLALGLQFQTDIDDLELSWGGGYRASSGYGFSPGTVYHSAESQRVFLSALAVLDSWRLGAEYSNTYLDAASGVPQFVVSGYQAALGYELSRNVQITAGWQFYNYERDLGTFYNGNNRININAGCLTVGTSL